MFSFFLNSTLSFGLKKINLFFDEDVTQPICIFSGKALPYFNLFVYGISHVIKEVL